MRLLYNHLTIIYNYDTFTHASCTVMYVCVYICIYIEREIERERDRERESEREKTF